MSSSGPRPPAVHFRPRFEKLEDRTVPAGNITTHVDGGVLFVVGDDQANQFSVSGTGSWGAIVRPLGDTTLNGKTDNQQFDDLSRGYDIKSLGGDDVVIVSGVTARRGLRIELGDGNDTLILEDSTSRRETTVFGGAGDDTFTITDSNLQGRTAIDQEGGDDRLSAAATSFGKDTFFTGGTGTNTLGVDGNSFRRDPQTVGYNVVQSALPTAATDFAQVSTGGTATLDVLANDRANGGTLNRSTVTLVGRPSAGTAVVNADGTITYTSTGSTDTIDSFAYTVTDTAGGTSNAGVVNVAVTATGSAPTQPSPPSPPSPPPPPDATAPNVVLTSSATDVTNGTPVSFTARFDEAVTGFDQSDVSVSNGTVSNFVATNASTYTFSVTPGTAVPVTVRVAAGAAQDAAGNASTAASTVILPSLADPNWTPIGTQGLRFWDIQQGDGSAVRPTSTITVKYTGWLAADGTVFDSTDRNGGNPATFPITNLIQGWQQGLQGMKVGGIRRLDIPSSLGYGPTGSPPSIPANARLVFQIELVNEA